MAEQFTIQKMIRARPEQVIQTWLESRLHNVITGGNYQIDPVAGGKFTAWDGYITGTIIEIEPPIRISMHWRASEFPQDAPDSQLELSFEGKGNETLITLKHSNIPEGLGESYRQGWLNFYLNALAKYYSKTDKTGKNDE
ncbi:MAG: SRPBCC domain-containing protein [Anaerolineaceae bacterium]